MAGSWVALKSARVMSISAFTGFFLWGITEDEPAADRVISEISLRFMRVTSRPIFPRLPVTKDSQLARFANELLSVCQHWVGMLRPRALPCVW